MSVLPSVVASTRDRFNQAVAKTVTPENGRTALAFASTFSLGGASISQLMGGGISREYAVLTLLLSAYIAKDAAMSKRRAGEALLAGAGVVVMTKTAMALVDAAKTAKTGVDTVRAALSIFRPQEEDNSIPQGTATDPSGHGDSVATKRPDTPGGVAQEDSVVEAPAPSATRTNRKMQAFLKLAGKIGLMTLKQKRVQKFVAGYIAFMLVKHLASRKVKAMMKKLPF